MGWTNDQPDSLTEPPSAQVGDTRIVIGSDVPANLQANGVNFLHDTVNACIIFYESGWTPADTGYKYIAQYSGGSVTFGTDGPGGPYELISMIGSTLALADSDWDPGIDSTLTVNPLPTETWHPFPYLNGWADAAGWASLMYRRVPSPSKSAEIVGAFQSPAAWNFNVGKLPRTPIDYTSVGKVHVPAFIDGAPAIACALVIDSTGTVQAFGSSTVSTVWHVNGIYPITR